MLLRFELIVDTEARDERLSLYEVENDDTEDDDAVVEIDARDERASDRWGNMSKGGAFKYNMKIDLWKFY